MKLENQIKECLDDYKLALQDFNYADKDFIDAAIHNLLSVQLRLSALVQLAKTEGLQIVPQIINIDRRLGVVL